MQLAEWRVVFQSWEDECLGPSRAGIWCAKQVLYRHLQETLSADILATFC